MARGSEDLYGNFGSVAQPSQLGGVGTPNPNRANAADFGSQIGAGEEKLGEAGSQVANQFGGMIMETAANQAELGYIKASGDLRAKYSQYEGLQAEAMRPQYEAELQGLHDQYRANLPMLASKQFDANTIRSLGVQTSDYANYAAGQVKQANLKSHDALADTAIAGAGNLSAVLNPQQFGELAASVTHSGNAIADIRGDTLLATGTNPDTGNYSYPDTPEGKAAEARHLQYTNAKLSQLYITGAKTIADNQGASAAADWAKQHWDMMPDAAKVQMNQFIAPKMKNEIISGNVNNAKSSLEDGWNQQVNSNVPSSPTEAVTAQQNPLDVIRKNEGVGYSKDNKGEVINGINSLAFPKEFGEAKNILDTQGQAAATKYADNFYQKNIIDKYNIGSLPANTQAIVADGLVNHGGGDFGQSLVDAARNGASPEQLIDMRRQEYQRLNDTGKPEYTSQFDGWNKRLDILQTQQGGQAYANKADYYRANEDKAVQDSVNSYLQKYPDDYYGSQIQERRARTEIRKAITDEDSRLKSDRDTVTNAIGGFLTKGVPVSSYSDLQAIPGMQPVLDKVRTEQGNFAETIDTMIAKASHRDDVTNSANGFDTIMRTLEPHDQQHPNSIASVDHLAKGLGSSNSGESITWKDFQDAKPAVELDPEIKQALSKHMTEISNANGNVDGKGQDRAIQWYNQAMSAWKQNGSLGDKAMSPSDFASSIGEKDGPPLPTPPSRMQQISNWASSLVKSKESPAPSMVTVMNPNGQLGTVPAENLEKALAAGYKKAQ